MFVTSVDVSFSERNKLDFEVQVLMYVCWDLFSPFGVFGREKFSLEIFFFSIIFFTIFKKRKKRFFFSLSEFRASKQH